MYMYSKKCVWAFYQNKLDICNAADFQHHTVRISFGCQIIEISGASSYNV